MTLSIRQYLTDCVRPVNRFFLVIFSVILLFGSLTFFSASFGLLGRDGPSFSSVVWGQILFGLLPGALLAYFISRIQYTLWRRIAIVFFIATICLNLLLLAPSLSYEHGGAVRWLKFGSFTLQPSEFLKIAFILYLASWLSGTKERLRDAKYGLIPFGIILGITTALLIFQRDTDTAVVMVFTALAMYFVAGAKLKDILIIGVVGIMGLIALFYTRPYLMERFKVFLDPSRDPVKSGYQVSQSLTAIGSGQVIGRGFGRSLQKFSRLPEPIGDSIFAVIGEEFGFAGSTSVIVLFFMFVVQGIRIAIRAPDSFGRLITLGIVIMISIQSFINIASMLGLVPISGLPLIFISHGGTALLSSLAAIGIVLNVSRHIRTN